jgi:hypothetical protein
MNAKSALIKALLDGKVLSIKTCFETIGLTNIGRELPRMVEKPFGVVVSRTPMTGKSRYGSKITYTNYRLNKTEQNIEGIKKMMAYLANHSFTEPPDTSANKYFQPPLL